MSVAISNLSATWSNSANVYNAISINVTTNAYDANSTILNLKANGNSVFSVAADGTANIDFISINGYGKGNVGDVITSNGSNSIMWTSASSVTNLGVIVTTSGASQTLSGLSLSKYKQILLSFNNIGPAATGGYLYFMVNGTGGKMSDVTSGQVQNAKMYGQIIAYLENGLVIGQSTIGGTGITPNTYIQSINFSGSNTSITIGLSSSTFSTGNVIVYGIK